MRLYVAPFAPNPMRVLVVMREKGVEAEVVDVTTLPPNEYKKFSPLGQVPALLLDNGHVLTESLTICQYLDAVSGAPFLFGDGTEDRARIGMLERRAEMGLLNPAVEFGHHTHPMFAGRLEQHPNWAKTLIPRAEAVLDLIADALGRTHYLAGEEISAADFTATIGYLMFVGYGAIAPRDGAIQRWAAGIVDRDSMAPMREMIAAFRPDLLTVFRLDGQVADEGVRG